MDEKVLKIRRILDDTMEKINTPAFVEDDPVQFPRRFHDRADVEIAALLCSHIAWGNRPLILRDCDKLLGLMADNPSNFVLNADFESIPDGLNIHRTFFGRHLKYMLRGLRAVLKSYGSVESFYTVLPECLDPDPAWRLAAGLNEIFKQENGGLHLERTLPANLASTPLKRLNMALRWLVRDDGRVDIGLWKAIKPSELYIPLDVHVANVSRRLGLLDRKSNDRKAVMQLTEQLRAFDAEDPCKYDFALFGIGVYSR